MKLLKIFLIILLAYLLQVIVVSRFALFGVKADVLLILTTIFAVTYGAEEGLIVGFLSGLTQDLFGGPLYIHLFSKSILGFLVGTFKESVLGTEQGVMLIAVLSATVTNFIFEMLLLFFFFGRPLASLFALTVTIIITCIYNSILTMVIYPAVKLSFKAVME